MRILYKIFKSIILILPFLMLIPAFLLKFGYINIYRNELPHEIFSDMDYQSKIKPQTAVANVDNNLYPFVPPANTLPANYEPYMYEQIEYEKAEISFNNPLSDSYSNSQMNRSENMNNSTTHNLKEISIYLTQLQRNFIFSRGKYLFETYCIYCHGRSGQGDGTVVTNVVLKNDEEGFPKPPLLTGVNTKQKSDARLFHILSAGQNLMFPVADRISETDRWIIVNYIRCIQNSSDE